MKRKGYILVEGHGEVKAVANLVNRITKDLPSLPFLPWHPPLRWKNLQNWSPSRGKGGLEKGANYIRTMPDVGVLLILRDEDDACPKELAPRSAKRLRDLQLRFPVAYVLLHPEYEVLFLPCLHLMCGALPDGRQGLKPGTAWDRDSWEARRGIKEWLSKAFPAGKAYKPTLDQLPLTQKLDLDILRRAHVPCFGSLERAIEILLAHQGKPGVVYP